MNVGVVGCGTMGRVHARTAKACGLKIAACCDAHDAAARSFANSFRADVAKSASDLVKRADVDVVVITTPTPDHLNSIKLAALAGKHIFCEKPFGRTVRQCEEALRAVDNAGVKLFVGHVVRYFQEFEAIRAQVDSGKIGKPGFAKIFRGGIFPGGEKSWFGDYDKSGGAVLDMLIHDLDWLRYAFGEPKRIFCRTLMRTRPQPLDYAQITLRMESGLIANLVGSWAHPEGFRVKAEVCGSKGMVQFDSAEIPLTAAMRAHDGAGPKTIVPASPVDVSPFQLEWDDFLAWLDRGRTPRVTPSDALEAVRMAEAALTSAKKGEPVTIRR